MSQDGVPVMHVTAKARIRRKKWTIGYDRAAEVYGGRRRPKFDVERKWPGNVQLLYARLRSGHAKELRDYMYKIDQRDDLFCDCGLGVEQTIEHVM